MRKVIKFKEQQFAILQYRNLKGMMSIVRECTISVCQKAERCSKI